MPRVFISYSHRQKNWVRNRLIHVVRASGAEAILDAEVGQAGRSLTAQMTDWVDQADHILAVLSPDYLASKACGFEWQRSLSKDPGFVGGGTLIPVLREECDLPAALQSADPLYVDLREDGPGHRSNGLEERWDLLVRAWEGNLGTRVTDWLQALEEIVRFLQRYESVNFVATGPVRWAEVIQAVGERLEGGLPVVDLGDVHCRTRAGFLIQAARTLGLGNLTKEEPDIVAFSEALRSSAPVRVAFKRFSDCQGLPGFDGEFFNLLRHHRTDDWGDVGGERRRRLTLLVHTKCPLAAVLPEDQRDSWFDCQRVALATAR